MGRGRGPATSIAWGVVLLLCVAWGVGLLLSAASGCAGSKGPSPSSAASAGLIEVPEHFLVGDLNSNAMREPAAHEGCHSPMVDPRDGTRITLIRSSEGMGDYEVAEGRYGVTKGHLLRLDCSNGRVMGVVKR